MKKRQIIIPLFLVLLVSFCLIFINRKNTKDLSVTYSVIKDERFNGIYAQVSIEDFLAKGFDFGDSLKVIFSNGLVFDDLPFYNGYYVKTGKALVCGYPGYPYITITRSSVGLWDESELKEGDSVTISLVEKGKYQNIQDTLNQSYSNNREDYLSDQQFINARSLVGKNLKENYFYRGASFFDNSKGRAEIVIKYLEDLKIGFILDLADKEEEISQAYMDNTIASDYINNLYYDNKIAALGLNASYGSIDYKNKLATGLRKMMNNEGPVYIHCLEGKDRTGFVCFLLEALSGSTYDEMKNDYMETYKNYFNITKEASFDKYQAIVDIYFDSFVECLLKDNDKENADYQNYAKEYLLEANMTENEINDLILFLSK